MVIKEKLDAEQEKKKQAEILESSQKKLYEAAQETSSLGSSSDSKPESVGELQDEQKFAEQHGY